MDQSSYEIGIAVRPLQGEVVSGDQAAAWRLQEGGLLTALVDGLGHGEDAHIAATECIAVISDLRNLPLVKILEECHRRLHGTRGAVVALACFEAQLHRVSVVSVGNVATLLAGIRKHRFTAAPGIVGQGDLGDPLVQSAEFVPGRDLLFMASDGMDEDLDSGGFSRALFPSLQSMANVLLQKGALATDDASLLVVG